jgi:hypothetical protein
MSCHCCDADLNRRRPRSFGCMRFLHTEGWDQHVPQVERCGTHFSLKTLPSSKTPFKTSSDRCAYKTFAGSHQKGKAVDLLVPACSIKGLERPAGSCWRLGHFHLENNRQSHPYPCQSKAAAGLAISIQVCKGMGIHLLSVKTRRHIQLGLGMWLGGPSAGVRQGLPGQSATIVSGAVSCGEVPEGLRVQMLSRLAG